MRFAFEAKHEEPGTARDRNSIVCGDVMERLQGWSNRPRYKFVIAVSEQFTFRLFATGGLEDSIEHTITSLLDRFFPQDGSHVEIHVFCHAFVECGVRGDLDTGNGLASETASTASGKNDDVSATCDHSGHAGGIEAGRIHNH